MGVDHEFLEGCVDLCAGGGRGYHGEFSFCHRRKAKLSKWPRVWCRNLDGAGKNGCDPAFRKRKESNDDPPGHLRQR